MIKINKKITIGIPAFEADKYLSTVLASIQIQSIKDLCKVIIASDSPDLDYSSFKNKYPELDIDILECEENVGPGLARQKILDKCDTEWLTFIDANDIYLSPFSLEWLYNEIQYLDENFIIIQGIFCQELSPEKAAIDMDLPARMIPCLDKLHTSCLAKLYRVSFLREKNIRFSDLRAMEDGEFNYKIYFTIKDTKYKVHYVNKLIYLWRINLVNSITQKGMDKSEVPIYNWDLGAIGFTVSMINAIDFYLDNQHNIENLKTEIFNIMLSHYLLYVECLNFQPVFKDLNLFNAKRFYNNKYALIEHLLSIEEQKEYFSYYVNRHSALDSIDSNNLIPFEDFNSFMQELKKLPYNGIEEFHKIREQLPQYILDLDETTKVLNNNNYLYTHKELEHLKSDTHYDKRFCF